MCLPTAEDPARQPMHARGANLRNKQAAVAGGRYFTPDL